MIACCVSIMLCLLKPTDSNFCYMFIGMHSSVICHYPSIHCLASQHLVLGRHLQLQTVASKLGKSTVLLLTTDKSLCSASAMCPQTRNFPMRQLRQYGFLAVSITDCNTSNLCRNAFLPAWCVFCRNLALLLCVQGWMPRLQLLLMSHAAFCVLHLQVRPTSSYLLLSPHLVHISFASHVPACSSSNNSAPCHVCWL